MVWNIYMGRAESLGSIVGGSRACPCIILVLYECTWNSPAVSLILQAFENTGSLGSPPHQVVYPCLNGSSLGDCFPLHCWNREAELKVKTTTFSSLLLLSLSLSLSFFCSIFIFSSFHSMFSLFSHFSWNCSSLPFEDNLHSHFHFCPLFLNTFSSFISSFNSFLIFIFLLLDFRHYLI